jgi:hypothetical protein
MRATHIATVFWHNAGKEHNASFEGSFQMAYFDAARFCANCEIREVRIKVSPIEEPVDIKINLR